MSHYIIDPLSNIAKLNHPVADLVRDYLASEQDWKVDGWFIDRVETFFRNDEKDSAVQSSLDTADIDKSVFAKNKVRLVSILPHYFRGFRNVEHAIDLSGDLVVIDGRNSSGKTSLAEAIEWVLTNGISRRSSGDPKELSDCIANRFKLDTNETWVELVLDKDGDQITLRRLLVKDYDSRKDSLCESRVLMNGKEITDSSEEMVSLFVGVPPLIMQHSLMQLVVQNPTERRNYFERLLNLDRITSLIQNAVVGDERLARITRDQGGEMLGKWNKLKKTLSDSRAELFSDVERSDRCSMEQTLLAALRSIAVQHFGLDAQLSLDKMVEHLHVSLRRTRERRFPLLEMLRPKRSLDPESMSQLSEDTFANKVKSLQEAQENFETAKESGMRISEAQEVIASTLTSLRSLGLIKDLDIQICPLCEFGEPLTLSRQRIDEIYDWNIAREIPIRAKSEFQVQLNSLRETITTLMSLRQGLIPKLVPGTEWPVNNNTELNAGLTSLKSVYQTANRRLERFDQLGTQLTKALASVGAKPELGSELIEFLSMLKPLATDARTFSDTFKDFEKRLGEVASADVSYANRQEWIKLYDHSDELIKDLIWESSKDIAQSELIAIRNDLIRYRQSYLEARRQGFTEGISEIWAVLREGRNSRFSRIVIPKPRGKGYPVRIEVKAVLEDSLASHEVDALNVLSESQINVIGIAAFITRSRMLGHECLVFDDPIQSMDDEHFKTFANQLLNYLCDSGFQVIILTHNDRFARDISHYHFDRDGYVTLKTVHSRKDGVKVTEGNRRVAERLMTVEKLAEDGNLGQAWKTVRLALERLYIVLQTKYGPPGFDPRSWYGQSAEYMWSEGVAEIIAARAPGSQVRLKEILGFSASGVHDTAELGSTNLIRAIKDIRPLLSQLRIGG